MIWVIGSEGMLGSELRRALTTRRLAFTASDMNVDVTDHGQLLDWALEHRPKWVVNCAAYTDVDRAEDEEEQARRINALGAENVARVAHELGARLLHISTNYVFDGESHDPYTETAKTNPINAYGRSKEEGEGRVRETCPRHFIVRTAWLHGPDGDSFVATMLRMAAEREEFGVVSDQIGSPTYTDDLVIALLAFIRGEASAYGTYHYTNAGSCSWYEFALEIRRAAVHLGLLTDAARIRPIPSSEYPTPAARPKRTVLATTLIEHRLEMPIPSWQDGVYRHLQTLVQDR